MSEFKYACPVCGQHIKCDVSQAGSVMECPTCFQKIVAPQAPAAGDAKLILTGMKADDRPMPTAFKANPAAARNPDRLPGWLVGGGILFFTFLALAFIFYGTKSGVPLTGSEYGHGDETNKPATNSLDSLPKSAGKMTNRPSEK